jgi:hypothetical protein
MLKSQVEMLKLEKLALSEKYDMLYYFHNELIDDHIMLNIAHEVVMTSLNYYEPHSCSCANLDNTLSCSNPCCSKKSQSSIEKKIAGKINRNKRRMRRRRLCWGLVLKCYELRTRQHKMLNVNVLRPQSIIPLRIMIFGRRSMRVQLRSSSLRN